MISTESAPSSTSTSPVSTSTYELLKAISDRDITQFEFFLDHRFDGTNCTEDNVVEDSSVLEYAVHEGFHRGVEVLLSKRSLQPKCVEKSLVYAMTHSLIDVVRVFLISALEDVVCLSVFDVFRYAMHQKHFDLAARAAQRRDFDVNTEDIWSQHRPLGVAVYNVQPHLVEMLLQNGAVLEASDGSGMTALIVGCVVRSVDCCRVLLEHGANTNPRPPAVCSPLRALYCYSTDTEKADEVVELLLRAGLNMNRERWVQKLEPSPNKISASTHEHLRTLSCNPLTLKVTCFVQIRQNLERVQHGLSILTSISSLPLPNYLKKYLQMTSN